MPPFTASSNGGGDRCAHGQIHPQTPQHDPAAGDGRQPGGVFADVPGRIQTVGQGDVRLHPVGTGPFKLAGGSRTRSSSLRKTPTTSSPGSPTWIALSCAS